MTALIVREIDTEIAGRIEKNWTSLRQFGLFAIDSLNDIYFDTIKKLSADPRAIEAAPHFIRALKNDLTNNLNDVVYTSLELQGRGIPKKIVEWFMSISITKRHCFIAFFKLYWTKGGGMQQKEMDNYLKKGGFKK